MYKKHDKQTKTVIPSPGGMQSFTLNVNAIAPFFTSYFFFALTYNFATSGPSNFFRKQIPTIENLKNVCISA